MDSTNLSRFIGSYLFIQKYWLIYNNFLKQICRSKYLMSTAMHSGLFLSFEL